VLLEDTLVARDGRVCGRVSCAHMWSTCSPCGSTQNVDVGVDVFDEFLLVLGQLIAVRAPVDFGSVLVGVALVLIGSERVAV